MLVLIAFENHTEKFTAGLHKLQTTKLAHQSYTAASLGLCKSPIIGASLGLQK